MFANLRERAAGRACQDAEVTVEIVYCEGWDPVTRSVVRPLAEGTAHERDLAGDQYAILLTGERPLALVEICWTAHHAAVWCFDEHGRRDRRLEFRRWPDDHLVLREARQWAYPSADTPEFHGDEPAWRAPYWRAEYDVDGTRRVSSGDWQDRPDLDVPTRHPMPAFGDWTPVVGGDGPSIPRPDPADPPEDAEPPWQPPRPLRPGRVDDTFRPGATYELDGGVVAVEVVDGGRLALPSGRLIAADPDPWLADVTPFAETVRPGGYPLELAVVRFVDTPEHTRVAACRLLVSEWPTTSWDTAWRDGEHPLLLGDGEFFGVGVDGGRVALVDAEVAPAFAETIEDAYDDMRGWSHELPEPESGANLITVESGWGDGAYPVWVGRDAGDAVTCFVVDFLVLAHAKRVG